MSSSNGQDAGESVRLARFVMERSEARLEVDSREVGADSSWASCNAFRTECFAGNILGGSKASNRALDEVAGAAAGRNSRRDSVDMLGSAFDAWVSSSRAAEGAAHNDRAVSVLNRHLQRFQNERENKAEGGEENENKKKRMNQ